MVWASSKVFYTRLCIRLEDKPKTGYKRSSNLSNSFYIKFYVPKGKYIDDCDLKAEVITTALCLEIPKNMNFGFCSNFLRFFFINF